MLCMFAGFASAQYSGGDGTQENPYRISSVEDLADMATAVSGGETYSDRYFVVTNDIGSAGNPVRSIIGSSSRKFCGVFDGRNYTIFLDISATAENAGLFGYVNKTSISNVVVAGNRYVNKQLCWRCNWAIFDYSN